MERSVRTAGLALACLTAVVLSSAGPAVHGRPGTPAASPAGAVGASETAADPEGATDAVGHGPAYPAPPPAFPAQDRVGVVLVSPNGPPRHHCTGSVVLSPRRDLVLTAAHCVHGGAGGGYRAGLAFAPGLRGDGSTPAGRWRVRTALAMPSWTAGSDPSADVAFLVLEPLDGRRVQDVVGGNPIAFDHPDGGTVQLVGYPSGEDTPVVCDGMAARDGLAQLRVRCPGFRNGTSGSPWLSGAEGGVTGTGSGAVVGVIGGYRLGGDTPDVSYSSYFDARVRALYAAAVALS